MIIVIIIIILVIIIIIIIIIIITNYLAVDNPRGGFSCPLFQVELEFGTQPTCDYRKLIT